jgi:hypothetical protein
MKFVGVRGIIYSYIGFAYRSFSFSFSSFVLLLRLILLQSGSFAPNFLCNPNGTFHSLSCKISSKECRVAGNPHTHTHTNKANDFLCHCSSFSAFLSENKFSPTWTIDLSILKYNPFVPLEFLSAVTDTSILSHLCSF